MKILILGGNGQLGKELIYVLKKGETAIGKISEELVKSEYLSLDIDDIDISDLSSVKKVFKSFKPDTVINCAAYTNVDGCEENIEVAFSVNSLGARNLAICSQDIGAKLIHISTDYVFSGQGNTPYIEWDNADPKSIYGKSKYLGERYVEGFCKRYFIVRTSWLYGYNGKNFVYTIKKIAADNKEIRVVNDQVGNPTYANDLVYHILKMVECEEYGVYHCTGEGECSWYDFAKEIVALFDIECNVKACTSDEFKQKAIRPKYSSLNNMMLNKTFGNKMRNWKDALKDFVKRVNEEGNI